MAIMDTLTAKVGPLPLWAYGLIAAGGGFYYFNKKKTATSGTTGDQGQLATGTGSYSTTTTDASGNQTQYSYSGPAYSPGYISGQDYLGGYGSGQDIFVNVPGNTGTLQGNIPLSYPPSQPGAAPVGKQGSYWYTPTTAMDTAQLTNAAYGLNPNVSSSPALVDRAVDAMRVQLANPQIDWTSPVQPGTPVFIPLAGGTPGRQQSLPSGATQNAPSSYTPPQQQVSVSLLSNESAAGQVSNSTLVSSPTAASGTAIVGA